MYKKCYNEDGDRVKKIIVIMFILFLVGCSKNEYITCNIDINNEQQNYIMRGSYKIYYKDNYVTKIEENEKYISNDEYMLEYFNESKNLDYYNLNDLYGGYTYNINKNENNIDLSVIIDIESVDIKNMIKDKKIDQDYIVGNRLTTTGAIKIYESKGAICGI